MPRGLLSKATMEGWLEEADLLEQAVLSERGIVVDYDSPEQCRNALMRLTRYLSSFRAVYATVEEVIGVYRNVMISRPTPTSLKIEKCGKPSVRNL